MYNFISSRAYLSKHKIKDDLPQSHTLQFITGLIMKSMLHHFLFSSGNSDF